MSGRDNSTYPPRSAPPAGHMDTRVIHAGQAPEPITGALMPPVFQTSTYAQEAPGRHTGYEYARTQNPTREALERCIAALEGGEHGIAFASGLAATQTVLQTLPEDAKVVGADDLYGGTFRLFNRVYARRSITFSYADLSKAAPEDAIPEGTHLVWLETPTNPLLKVIDIAVIAARCKAVGALLAVDNTFATPVFQRPLELGADLVVHSTTKYLNGHSDVVGGIAVTSHPQLAADLRFLQNAAGAVPGPWDTWLTLRGLKTLCVRMEKHQQNARQVVDWLSKHPAVVRLHYPYPVAPARAPLWHESDPGFAVASRQMSGFGGMISFVLDCDLARAERFVSKTRLFALAESLGGVESLIELPAAMTHASVPKPQRQAVGIEDGLVRLSVGIENAADLLEDLDQAWRTSAS